MHAFKGVLLFSINKWIKVENAIYHSPAPPKKNLAYATKCNWIIYKMWREYVSQYTSTRKAGLSATYFICYGKKTIFFSRRLQIYLWNIILESRLVGFILFAIHRDIYISNDRILDTFANSGKAWQLKSLIIKKCY